MIRCSKSELECFEPPKCRYSVCNTLIKESVPVALTPSIFACRARHYLLSTQVISNSSIHWLLMLRVVLVLLYSSFALALGYAQFLRCSCLWELTSFPSCSLIPRQGKRKSSKRMSLRRIVKGGAQVKNVPNARDRASL